jgi:hypothetical protein
MPCGPQHQEVCPLCWLAIECDDFLCMAPSLQVALDMLASTRDHQMTEQEFYELTKDMK